MQSALTGVQCTVMPQAVVNMKDPAMVASLITMVTNVRTNVQKTVLGLVWGLVNVKEDVRLVTMVHCVVCHALRIVQLISVTRKLGTVL